MNISDELVMAYADGELDTPERAADRAAVEAAMRSNPDIARRVERHRALRRRLSATFDRVLDEPVPDRLIAAVRASASTPAAPPSAARASAEQSHGVSPAAPARPNGTVSSLDRARADRAAKSASRGARWSLPQWAAIAASIIVGVLLGHFALTSREEGLIASRNGQLVAQADLASALSNQLASDQPATAPVQINTSFKSKSGNYCRTFVLHNGSALAGLACHAGTQWNINALARAEPASNTTGGYRQAGSEIPDTIRAQVESQIVGDPLDSSGEAQAKANGWK
jgi:hypothetical protein